MFGGNGKGRGTGRRCTAVGGSLAACFAAVFFIACVGEDPDTPPPPLDPPGTKCTRADQCESKNCVDGYCCNTACAGQCEACDSPEKEGTCSFILGVPVGGRTQCAGSGSCAGSCDGTTPACHYPASSVVCGAACDGTCDAAGGCTSATGGNCPNGFACGPSACLTSCSNPGDCQPLFQCDSETRQCFRKPEKNCLDGEDDNGDGLADCADPTCSSQVECVPAPGATGELGLVEDTGPCPADYATATTLHAGLSASTCTGCSCQTTCQSTMSLWNTNVQCPASGAIAEVISGVANGGVICKNFAAGAGGYYSATVSAVSIAGCNGSGTAAQADPTWATTKTFCGAKSTATCADPTKRCVAKSTEKRCARGPQADACPSGYTDDRGLMYTGFTKGSCTGSCTSCTAATGQCKHALNNAGIINDAANCPAGSGSIVDNGCKNLYGAPYAAVSDAFLVEGGDNCMPNITNVPPVETGAARLCCEP